MGLGEEEEEDVAERGGEAAEEGEGVAVAEKVGEVGGEEAEEGCDGEDGD